MPDEDVSNAVTGAPTMPSVPTTIPPFDDRRKPWVTSKGIWIGGARRAQDLQQSPDADRFQALLLRFPTTRDGQAVSVIETDTSLRARAARALRSFTSALRHF